MEKSGFRRHHTCSDTLRGRRFGGHDVYSADRFSGDQHGLPGFGNGVNCERSRPGPESQSLGWTRYRGRYRRTPGT